jgi:hypothetical protein
MLSSVANARLPAPPATFITEETTALAPSESDLLGLIGLIYDTTENPARWSEFMERYAETFAADVAFIQRHHLGRRTSQMITTFGLAAPFKAAYNEHYSRLNVWRDRGHQHYIQGRAIVDEQMCPRATLVNTEFYNDYLVPTDRSRTSAT